MKAQLEIGSNVHIQVWRDGRRVRKESVRNMVVATGRNVMRDLLNNVGNAPGFVAVGTGAGTSAVEDTNTALNAEVFRNVFTRTFSATSRSIYKLLLKTTDANGNTLNEAGLFAGSNFSGGLPVAGGILVARAIFAPIVKDNTVQVTITWEILIRSV